MNRSARVYAYTVIAAGSAVVAGALVNWSSDPPSIWLVYLTVIVLSSVVKLRLPHISGTYSLSSLVLLYGLAYFSPAELVVAACAAAAAQSLLNSRQRPQWVQVWFNMANLSLSVAFCALLRQALLATGLGSNPAALLSALAFAYFVVNTVLVSGVLALLQGKTLGQTCSQWYLWSFPYYLVGAALVGLAQQPQTSKVAEAWLILVPLIYLIHFFFGLAQWRGAMKIVPEPDPAEALPKAARFYLSVVIAAGGFLLWVAAVGWQSADPLRFAVYLMLAVAASTLKVKLPGITSTLSPNFVLLLVAISQLSLPEAALMAMVSAVTQSLWKPRTWPRPEQVLFNAASVSLSVSLAYLVCNRVMAPLLSGSLVGRMALATLILYGANTLIVALILCLVDQKPLHSLCKLCHFWAFPYYLVGAAVAALMTATAGPRDWLSPLPILLLMTLIYVSYRTQVAEAVR